MDIKGGNPKDRLDDFEVKGDGSVVEFTGNRKASFLSEFKMKILTNGIIAFMKGFPGFAEWWFTNNNEKQREMHHTLLQLKILSAFDKISGTSTEKARALRDVVVKYFDKLPGFNQWEQVVLGTDLRSRIQNQLKSYVYDELKKVR